MHRSPTDRDKLFAWVTCQPNGADGQLIVWDSGGAELDVGRLDGGDTRFAHYDLASATDVHARLDTLTELLKTASEGDRAGW